MNVNINTELSFSDVYRRVNYNGSLAKFTLTSWGSFTLQATLCCLHFDKPQQNEIHSLNGAAVKFTTRRTNWSESSNLLIALFMQYHADWQMYTIALFYWKSSS